MNVKIIQLIKNIILASDENRIKWEQIDHVYHYRTSGGVDVRISHAHCDLDDIYTLGIEFEGNNTFSDYATPLVHLLYNSARDNVCCQGHRWDNV